MSYRMPLRSVVAWATPLAVVVPLVLTGCTAQSYKSASAVAPGKPVAAAPDAADDVQAERAKLSAEDRALVEAQEWCVVQNDERLGAMGAPVKLMVKDQPVFVCCKSCQKKALADPDATLAKLAELKAKAAKPQPK